MPRGLSDRLRSWPMGLKVSVVLWVVVLGTALALSVVQYLLAQYHLEQRALVNLKGYLQVADSVMALVGDPKKDPRTTVANLAMQLQNDLGMGEDVLFYAVLPDGQAVLPYNASLQNLPAKRYLDWIVQQGWGHLTLTINERRNFIYFGAAKGGRLVLVVQAPRRALVGKAVDTMLYWTWLAAVGLCVLFTGLVAFMARRELSGPLQRLAEEGERMAAGDLTANQFLAGREDELGRLSMALNKLAITASETIKKAQRSQARFEQLFTDSRDAAFIINDQDEFEAMNPAALDMFGILSAAQMKSLGGSQRFFIRQSQRQNYIAALEKYGYVQDFPVSLRRLDGEEFEALITATLRSDGGARFGLIRDVTEINRARRALQESEERHRRILENAPDMIFRWLLNSQSFDYISPAAHAITGYTAEEIIDNPMVLRNCVHPDWRDQVFAQRVKLGGGHDISSFEMDFKLVHRSGELRWVRERSILVRGQDGEPLAVEGMASDITGTKNLERALIQGRRMVESILRSLPAAVMVIDQDHRIVHWNQAMARLTGVEGNRRVGTKKHWSPFYNQPRPVLADLVLEGNPKRLEEYYGENNLKRSTLVPDGMECEVTLENLGGKTRTLYIMAATIKDDDGRVTNAVETIIDISDKRELEEELTRLSVTDELTGLYNQRFFYATLKREVETSLRYDQPLSLLIMDLDHFKNYNDTYGHLEGDRVLSACAKLVMNSVRGTDLACRYGGEEFVVLLPHTPRHRAKVVAERIRAGIESLEFFPVVPKRGVRKARITASLGVALYQQKWSGRDLVRLADQAMYEAKHQGRNQVAIYQSDGGIELMEPNKGAING